MKIPDMQRKILKQLATKPHSYVRSLDRTLAAMDRNGWVYMQSRTDLGSPVWAITDAGREALEGGK